jgi:LemA protein
MPTFFITIVVVGILLVFFVFATYNKLVALRQNVRESWSAIETELRRRFDLIPNLVETVKGYASHERETLDAVIQARNSAMSSNSNASIESQVNSQNMLSGALGRLMALSEAYPDLKANQNFMQLQQELNETETRISQARRFYNANVKELNTACETLPSALIAGSFGFHPQPYYGIDDARALEPVSISFSNPAQDDAGARLKIQQKEVDKG